MRLMAIRGLVVAAGEICIALFLKGVVKFSAYLWRPLGIQAVRSGFGDLNRNCERSRLD